MLKIIVFSRESNESEGSPNVGRREACKQGKCKVILEERIQRTSSCPHAQNEVSSVGYCRSFFLKTHGQTLLNKFVYIVSWHLALQHDYVGTNFGCARSSVNATKHLWVYPVFIIYRNITGRHFVLRSAFFQIILCQILYLDITTL